jgi:hypothetical protein
MQTEKVIKYIEKNDKMEVASYESKYCPYCDFGYDNPEDSCLCDENCGTIGCQGSNVPQNA